MLSEVPAGSPRTPATADDAAVRDTAEPGGPVAGGAADERPAASGPVAVGDGSAGSASAEPSGAEPVTGGPPGGGVEPVCGVGLRGGDESVGAEPVGDEPRGRAEPRSAAGPVGVEPAGDEPGDGAELRSAAESVSADPVSAEPVSAEPVSAEPVSAEPRAARPADAEQPAPASDPGDGRPPAAGPPASRGSGPGRRWFVVAVVLAALLGGVVGGAVVAALTPSPAPARVSADPGPVLVAPAPGVSGVVAAVAPAVLRIRTGAPDTGTAGTAIVLTDSGDLVTNAHLVQGESVATLLTGERSYTARVVARDDAEDLAWLKVDGVSGLPVARLAAAGPVAVGEDVVTISNGLDLEGAPSVTRGVVSAVGRSTMTMNGLIQTDAATSSGSSGGALVDTRGAVVGIVTESLVGDEQTAVEDVAFAIPAERVRTVLAGMGLTVPPAG